MKETVFSQNDYTTSVYIFYTETFFIAGFFCLFIRVNNSNFIYFFFQGSEGSISRSKPFKYTYEKEIVMYAYFKKLDYFSTECIYSPNAYRGHARAFLKDLEKIRSTTIIDIIHSGEFRKDFLCNVQIKNIVRTSTVL